MRKFRYIAILIICFFLIAPAIGQKKKKKQLSEKDKITYKVNFFEANKHKILGNYAEAVDLFSRCIKIKPEEPVSYYEIARIYLQQSDLENAILYAKKAVELNNGNIYYLMLLAGAYEQNNQLANAADMYDDIIEKFPNREDIHLEYCSLLASIGKWKQALKELNKLEEQQGVNEMITLEKERLYQQNGKPEKALEEIEKLVESYPYEPRYYGMLAESYTSMNKFEKAEKAYDKLLELDPGNGRVHLSKADFYRITNKPEKSFEELKLAYENTNIDLDVKVRLLLSIYESTAKDPEGKNMAFELLNILLQTYPNEPRAHTMKADFLIRERKFKDAKKELWIVVKTEKSKYLIWEQLIKLEMEDFNYNGVYKASKNAIEYFPNQTSLYLYNGIAANRLKKYDEAVKSLQKGMEINMDDENMQIMLLSNLGEVQYRLKNYEKSDSSFEEVLKLDPNNKLVLNNYSYYLTVRKEKLKKATKMAKKVVEMEPTNATYLDTYAWALYESEDYNNALEYIKKALDNGGKQNGTIVEHYGDILFKNKKKEEAVNAWKEAKELGVDTKKLDEKIEKKQLFEN